METVTAAIIAALAHLSSTVIKDAYAALKTMIKNKYGTNSDLAEAVEQVEKHPDSKGRQVTLQEEVARSGAVQDPEIVSHARELLEMIEASSRAQGSSNVVNISGGTVQGFIQENKGQATMNIGKPGKLENGGTS